MVSRLRLTIVSSPLHAPPRDGASFFTQSTLRVLAEAGHEITLIVLQLTDDVSVAALKETYSARAIHCISLPYSGAGLVSKSARWLLSVRRQLPPAQVPYLASKARIRKLVNESEPDAVLALGGSAGLAVANRDIPVLVLPFSLPTGDVERARLNAWWRRLARRWEQRLAGNATILAATTDVEAAMFRDRFPRHVVRSIPFALESSGNQLHAGCGPRLLYIGDFGYPPNVVGASHLVSDVMPAIWSRRPDIELVIAGKLSADVDFARGDPRIKRLGEYGTLYELAAEGTLGVLPLSAAGGVRTRVFEYAAAGIPIVATAGSVEGLAPELLGGATVVPHAADLAEASLRLLDDPRALRDLGDAGRRAMAQYASPEVVIGRWQDLLQELIATTPA